LRSRIQDWDYEESDRRVKTYIWLINHDFLVILKNVLTELTGLLRLFGLNTKITNENLQKNIVEESEMNKANAER
jgi:hypothetical protein